MRLGNPFRNFKVSIYSQEYWVTNVHYIPGFAGDMTDPPYPASIEYDEIKPMSAGEIFPVDLRDLLKEDLVQDIENELIKEFQSE